MGCLSLNLSSPGLMTCSKKFCFFDATIHQSGEESFAVYVDNNYISLMHIVCIVRYQNQNLMCINLCQYD